MDLLGQIKFGFWAKLPMILQTEATECGLACLGMIAGYHGHYIDIVTLRHRFPVSLKGINLAHLIQFAKELGMQSRPLRLELSSLPNIRLPCILHWQFNHFVVLKEVERDYVTIHDPAFGCRRLPLKEVSNAFTGVALELWPSQSFEEKDERTPRLRLLPLIQGITGLKTLFGQIISLALALEVFGILSPIVTQIIIDDVLVSADVDLLTTVAVGIILIMLVQQAISVMRTWMIIYLGTTVNVQWRANVLSHLIRLPVDYFMKRHLGDILSRFGAIDAIQHTLTASFLSAILDGLMTIVTLCMMFVYSWKLALIAVIAMTAYALLRALFYTPLKRAAETQIVEGAKTDSYFLETIRGVRTIKLFQREEVRRIGWLSNAVRQINAGLSVQRQQLFFQTVNGLLFGAERIAVLWIGATMIIKGNFTVGTLMAFIMYKDQFDGRVGSLIDKFYEVKMLRIQTDRLSDIVLTEPEPDAVFEIDTDDAETVPRIELQDVCFRYGKNDPLVLNGVSASFEPGETVAVVGPSGCGKTTLMNILIGTVTPSEGQVLIGGIDLKQMETARIRAIFGTVCQDDYLFAGTIEDNICFFDARPDHEWIEECARTACIHADIKAMPMAYRTLVGDMGSALSGGQRQRVLIARALYKRPKILVLDEATSHLDVENEKIVSKAIKHLKMTRIIIAHRPETIASADRVIALAKGMVSAAPPIYLSRNGQRKTSVEDVTGTI